MSSYVIINQDTICTKKAVRKFSKKIPISNEKIEGVFTVTGYRKYKYCEDIDVEFYGKIFARTGFKSEWLTSDVMNSGRRISKIKVNRFIRKSLLKSIQLHMNYFGITIKHYSDIKKIKWL